MRSHAHLNCLLYADDIILMSNSPTGLQNCLTTTYNYCCKWGLDINYDKSNVMFLNKAGRLYNHKFNVDNVILESVRQYKYLGVLFCLSGSFTNALSDLYHRGQKAFFKVCSTFSSQFAVWSNTGSGCMMIHVVEALKDNLHLFNNSQDCWLKCLNTILNDINMMYIFYNPKSCKPIDVALLKRRLQQQFRNKWYTEIKNSDKLRTYKEF